MCIQRSRLNRHVRFTTSINSMHCLDEVTGDVRPVVSVPRCLIVDLHDVYGGTDEEGQVEIVPNSW